MRRLATALLALLAAALLAGCGGGRTSAPATSTAAGTTVATTTAETVPTGGHVVRVYFLRDGSVAPVARHIGDTQAVAHAALDELLAGPTTKERADGLTTDVPATTALRDVTIADGVATVSLSDAFAHGAEATIAPRLAEVVYTLTQFPSIRSVAFEVEGSPLDTVVDGQGQPLDHDAARTDYEALTPLILVESPLPGETVSNPLRVTGTANVFEATFRLEVRDAKGNVLTARTVTASSGAPERGTFDESLDVRAPAGPVELHAFDENQGTGKREHEVVVPLQLAG